MSRRVMILVLMVAAILLAPARSASAAADTAGCAGLTVYKAALERALTDAFLPYADELKALPNDAMAYDTGDWMLFADLMDAYGDELEDVTPPVWAEDWHKELITYTGVMENMAKTAASGGILAAAIFADAITDQQQDVVRARASAVRSCTAFGPVADDYGLGVSG